jgi:hypothetical protein
VGAVQEPVEEADGGGVLGQEPAHWSKGQWLAMPRDRAALMCRLAGTHDSPDMPLTGRGYRAVGSLAA